MILYLRPCGVLSAPNLKDFPRRQFFLHQGCNISICEKPDLVRGNARSLVMATEPLCRRLPGPSRRRVRWVWRRSSYSEENSSIACCWAHSRARWMPERDIFYDLEHGHQNEPLSEAWGNCLIMKRWNTLRTAHWSSQTSSIWRERFC